jgi:glycosyltransferase involved in cell wall biosynthesis
MKVAIATVQVPFIRGGAEALASSLQHAFESRGHAADIVSIPFKWYPTETLTDCMLAGRMMDLTEVNGEKIQLVVALKFPAYYLKHEHKVVWLLHQHRQAYDLWQTPFGDIHTWPDGDKLRDLIVRHDTRYLSEASRIYTISQNVTARLRHYNQLDSAPLYHPPLGHADLYCESFENFVFYPSRIDSMKRQRLLVEAARYIQSGMHVIVAGGGGDAEAAHLQRLVHEYGLENRVTLAGFISEDEKRSYYARCRCVFFGAYDEYYCYVTLEAFYARKPVVALNDTGGALEFVEHGNNGYICEPDARSLAATLDQLGESPALAEQLGNAAHATLDKKLIDWDHVVTSLIQSS